MEDFRLIRGRFVFDGDVVNVVDIVADSFAFAAFAANDAWTALGFFGGRPRPLLTGAGEAADADIADVLAFGLFNVKGELFLELFRLELFFDEARVVLLCRRRVADGDDVVVVDVLFLNWISGSESSSSSSSASCSSPEVFTLDAADPKSVSEAVSKPPLLLKQFDVK